MPGKGNIYFSSDFHLGLPTGTPPLEREKRVTRWLNMITPDAKEIYLLGDVFDFWWEYRLVVPKGFTRFLGTISSITDKGIPVHFFTGNHDMWVKDYFRDECGMTIHTSPVTTVFGDKTFHLAHGEGLGSRSRGYRILLGIFHNRPLRALYSSLHPRIGVGFGHSWSLHSRLGKGESVPYMGEEKEDLVRYARSILAASKIDYFIFGHRHLSMELKLQEGAVIYFLGDWISNGNYIEWNGTVPVLKEFR